MDYNVLFQEYRLALNDEGHRGNPAALVRARLDVEIAKDPSPSTLAFRSARISARGALAELLPRSPVPEPVHQGPLHRVHGH
jgi:hypothetical protein